MSLSLAELQAKMERRKRAEKWLDEAAKYWDAPPLPALESEFATQMKEHTLAPDLFAFLRFIRRGTMPSLMPGMMTRKLRILRNDGFVTIAKDGRPDAPSYSIVIGLTAKGKRALLVIRAAEMTKDMTRWARWVRRILGLPNEGELRQRLVDILDAAADTMRDFEPWDLSQALFQKAPWFLSGKQGERFDVIMAAREPR